MQMQRIKEWLNKRNTEHLLLNLFDKSVGQSFNIVFSNRSADSKLSIHIWLRVCSVALCILPDEDVMRSFMKLLVRQNKWLRNTRVKCQNARTYLMMMMLSNIRYVHVMPLFRREKFMQNSDLFHHYISAERRIKENNTHTDWTTTTWPSWWLNPTSLSVFSSCW